MRSLESFSHFFTLKQRARKKRIIDISRVRSTEHYNLGFFSRDSNDSVSRRVTDIRKKPAEGTSGFLEARALIYRFPSASTWPADTTAIANSPTKVRPFLSGPSDSQSTVPTILYSRGSIYTLGFDYRN